MKNSLKIVISVVVLLSISIVTFGYSFDEHMKDRVSIRDSVAFKSKKAEWISVSRKSVNETSYWDILNGYNNKLLSASDAIITNGYPFTIEFGTYMQNTSEIAKPIQWVIVEKKNGMALLMSLRMLDYRSLMDEKEENEEKEISKEEKFLKKMKDRFKGWGKDKIEKEIEKMDKHIKGSLKGLETIPSDSEKYILSSGLIEDEKKVKKFLEDLLNGKYNLDDNATTDEATIKWEESDLRKWLNNEFYNTAFSQTEKKRIKALSTNDGKDKVFLLTNKEKIKYLNIDSDKDYKDCGPWDASNWTQYSFELYDNDKNKNDYAYYWLRDGVASFAKNIPINNQPNEVTQDVFKKFGVRPCIWIVYDENAVSANRDYWNNVLSEALKIGIDYAIDKYLP